MASTHIDVFLEFLSYGVATIPVLMGSKVPAIKWDRFNPQNDYAKLPTLSQAEFWWSTNYNLAVVAGWNNLCIVDIDDMMFYSNWLCSLTGEDVAIGMMTYRVRTSRGIHLYFWSIGNARNYTGPYYSVKTCGLLATHPPSVVNGVEYYSVGSIKNILPAKVEDLFYIPDVIETTRSNTWCNMAISNVSNYFLSALRYECDNVCGAKPGSRNITLNRSSFKIGQIVHDCDIEIAESMLIDAGMSAGLYRLECVMTVRCGLRAGMVNRR